MKLRLGTKLLKLGRWMSEFSFDAFRQRIGTVGGRFDGGPSLRLGTFAWIGFDTENRPVSFLGGDLKVWMAGSEHGGVRPEVDGPRTLGFIYAVAGADRRLGYGQRTVNAVIDSLGTADVDVFSCFVATDNHASLTLLRCIDRLAEQSSSDRGSEFRYATYKFL